MANKSRIRKSKKRVSRKRNTRRNKKTGGGYLYNVIRSIGFLRTLEFTEPKKVNDAKQMFKDKLFKFEEGLSSIKNLPLLYKFLTAIDSQRDIGRPKNDIFKLHELETAVDNRISDVENYGKRNDRSIDQETAIAIYGDNYHEPKDY